MAELVDLDGIAAAVMPDVIAEIGGTTYEVTTRYQGVHATPPRVIFTPAQRGDRWEAPQKTPRGGGATGKSLATCFAGVDLHCWGDSREAAWQLVKALARALKKRLGPEPFLFIDGGGWLTPQGATVKGEAYVLQIRAALDVPATPAAPRTATPTQATFDHAHSTTGDGFTDAGETG